MMMIAVEGPDKLCGKDLEEILELWKKKKNAASNSTWIKQRGKLHAVTVLFHSSIELLLKLLI